MPTEVTIQIPPESIAVIERFKDAPARILRATVVAMDYQNELTVGAIIAKRLSQRGPETLGVVTGRLRRSIRKAAAVLNGESVTSSIGSNVVYAGVHEFGIDQEVSVKGFERRVPKLAKDVAKRTALSIRRHAAAGPGGIEQVRPHKRHMRLPARAFIRKTIEERGPEYGREIGKRIVADLNGEKT